MTDRLALPAHPPTRVGGNPSLVSRALVGSDTAPLLVKASGRAWRVQANPLRLEETVWPGLPTDALPAGGFATAGGFAMSDRLGNNTTLLLPRRGGPVVLADLATGATTPVPEEAADTGTTEGAAFDAGSAEALYADATGGVAVMDGTGGLALVGLDPAGTVLWGRTLPLDTCIVHNLFRLPDGRVLVTVDVDPTPSSSGALMPLTLVHDPAADAWALLDDACSGLAGERWLGTDTGAVQVSKTEDHGGIGLALEWLTVQ